MPLRVRWILFEALKLTVAAALFLWLGGRIMDARYEIYAYAEQIHNQQNVQEGRLRGLETERRESIRDIAHFRAELARWDEELAFERQNFNRLVDNKTGELRSWIESGMHRLEGTTVNQAQVVADRMSNLEKSIRRQPGEMKNRMIYPVVQLRGNGTVGSGVVIASARGESSEKYDTYILTAHHVVEEILSGDLDEAQVDELRFVDPVTDRLMDEAYTGTLEAFEAEVDIALLKVEMDEPWPYVARLATTKQVSNIEVFDRIYAVGCPLGNKPLPTAGEISSKTKTVADQTFWMINAPTFFGNSGGGVFLMDSGDLVGISSMIYTYGKRQAMVVPHMGLFVPLETLRSWLQDAGYSQLVEGLPHTRASAKAAHSTREKAQEKRE
ncbi:MAG: serine protease [Planctomycetota bacterium]